mgnify:CR=1 FL=1
MRMRRRLSPTRQVSRSGVRMRSSERALAYSTVGVRMAVCILRGVCLSWRMTCPIAQQHASLFTCLHVFSACQHFSASTALP